MKEFRFTLANRPGALAEVATALGAENVNIDGITGAPGGSLVCLVVNNPDRARTVLLELGVVFEEKEALAIDIPNQPGELGKLLGRLAAVGINLDSVYPAVEPNKVILTADDLTEARQTLGAS